MKTPEEILEHYSVINDCYLDDRYKTTAIEAMEEYAKQNRQRLEKIWDIQIKKDLCQSLTREEIKYYSENWRHVADECRLISDTLFDSNNM